MTDSSLKNLRANLQTVLVEQGLSQSELARRIGVHQRAINRIVGNVSEEHSPTLDTVEAIALGLGVSVSELLSKGFSPTVAQRDTEPREAPTLIRQTSRLIEDFFASSDAGRKKILKVAAECADNHLAEKPRGGA